MSLPGRLLLIVALALGATVIAFSLPAAWVNKVAVAPLTYLNLAMVLAMAVWIYAILVNRIKAFTQSPRWFPLMYRAGGVGFALSVLYHNLLYPFKPDDTMALAVSVAGLVCAIALCVGIIGAKVYARRVDHPWRALPQLAVPLRQLRQAWKNCAVALDAAIKWEHLRSSRLYTVILHAATP